MTDEEHLNDLRAEQKKLEDLILKSRKRIAEIREETTILGPKVEAATRKKEWQAGEPEREVLRQTPEFQAWKKEFLEKENLRKEEVWKKSFPVLEELNLEILKEETNVILLSELKTSWAQIVRVGREFLLQFEGRPWLIDVNSVKIDKLLAVRNFGRLNKNSSISRILELNDERKKLWP